MSSNAAASSAFPPVQPPPSNAALTLDELPSRPSIAAGSSNNRAGVHLTLSGFVARKNDYGDYIIVITKNNYDALQNMGRVTLGVGESGKSPLYINKLGDYTTKVKIPRSQQDLMQKLEALQENFARLSLDCRAYVFVPTDSANAQPIHGWSMNVKDVTPI
jgi:hypothetical protein